MDWLVGERGDTGASWDVRSASSSRSKEAMRLRASRSCSAVEDLVSIGRGDLWSAEETKLMCDE